MCAPGRRPRALSRRRTGKVSGQGTKAEVDPGKPERLSGKEETGRGAKRRRLSWGPGTGRASVLFNCDQMYVIGYPSL